MFFSSFLFGFWIFGFEFFMQNEIKIDIEIFRLNKIKKLSSAT